MSDVCEQITFSELDLADGNSMADDDQLLLYRNSEGVVKRITCAGLFLKQSAANSLLQGQITCLAGESGVEEKMNLSLKGTYCGVAELDDTGKVPSSQLPSFVDDVIEGYYKSDSGEFYEEYDSTTETYSGLITPESGKVYIDKETNITYRWSGSVYAVIGSDLALGETSSSAYRGDRGKIAYDHSQTLGTGTVSMTNPHGLAPADIGLGNVPNVTTNNQTPTYTTATSLCSLESGETLSIAMGKISKAVDSLISHTANTSNPHSVTKEQVGLGNVTNVGTSSTIQSGSTCNITSGAVYSALSNICTDISALQSCTGLSCTGTVTSVKVYCGTTCKCEIASSGSICLGTNAFNSTAFTTCTGTVTGINIYCGTTCKCSITTSGDICLGSNAFNSTAFTTCTGTVTSVNVSVNGVSGTAVTGSGTVTLTNVPPYFANGVLYKVGDDVCIGDVNQAGMIGIRSQNSTTMAGIKFIQCSGTASGCLYACASDNCLYYNGTKLGSGGGTATVYPMSCAGSSHDTDYLNYLVAIGKNTGCLYCICTSGSYGACWDADADELCINASYVCMCLDGAMQIMGGGCLILGCCASSDRGSIWIA